ncbi:hypothetical protein V2O64_23435 [Verrucomicrobiaceae bacterium 227]
MLETDQPRIQQTRADLTSDLRTFCREITTLPKATQLEKTDEFITRNRQGHFAISVANFLLELRELVELEIPAAELQPYLDWRTLQLPPPSPPRPPVKKWNAKPGEFNDAKRSYNEKLLTFLGSYDEQIDETSPRLKPFALTQRAGMYFRAGFLELAQSDFEDIITQYPDHPRSEVARFMLARVSLQAARTLREDKFPDENAYTAARRQTIVTSQELFHQYLEKHPDGRFANDSFGWLGGIAREDFGHLGEAVDFQVKRLASRPTREVTYSVLRECDQLFTSLFRNAAENGNNWENYYGDEPDFELLARQPLLARLLVSHSLDPAAQIHLPVYQQNFSGDRGTIEFLKHRIIAPGQFARHVLQRLGTAIVKNGTPSDPTSLLILGWSAARTGDHHQALSLFEIGLKIEVTDELLHAKAVALSRLEENLEAVRTYEELFTKFPDSTLVPPSRFDLAMAHLNSEQAGLALTIFLELQNERLYQDRKNGETDHLYLHPELEVPQWIDTIVQFSPLEQLEAGLKVLPADHPSRELFRRAISLRALCEERFELTRHLTIPEPTEVQSAPKRWLPQNLFDFTSDRWNRDVAPLIEAHQKLAAPNLSSTDQARLHLQIAQHWQSRRGQLTIPLHHLTGVYESEPDLLDKLRRDNALFRGLTRESIDQTLASRDELTHALKHYLAAAELSQDPDITAPALEGANEALFRMAEFTPDRAALASRNNHSELSQKFVARLRAEFPDRPETASAHPFTFLPPLLHGDWMPGDRTSWIAEEELAEVFDRYDEAAQNKANDISEALANLAHGETSLPDIQATLEQLARQFQTFRPNFDPETLISLSGHLEDLQLVAHHPGITAPLFREYLPIRLSKAAPPLSTDPTLPLSPFLDFLHQTQGPTPKYKWDDYNTRHPKSPKSEAISLRNTRIQVRRAFPRPKVRAIFFPNAPRSEGYKHLTFSKPLGDPTEAIAFLAAHRQKFPDGNYQADLEILDAAIAASAKNYPRALAILTRILQDPKHPELAQDASLQFAELSLRLLDLNERPTLLPAFKNNPAAREVLTKLALAQTCLARLRPFLPLD